MGVFWPVVNFGPVSLAVIWGHFDVIFIYWNTDSLAIFVPWNPFFRPKFSVLKVEKSCSCKSSIAHDHFYSGQYSEHENRPSGAVLALLTLLASWGHLRSSIWLSIWALWRVLKTWKKHEKWGSETTPKWGHLTPFWEVIPRTRGGTCAALRSHSERSPCWVSELRSEAARTHTHMARHTYEATMVLRWATMPR